MGGISKRKAKKINDRKKATRKAVNIRRNNKKKVRRSDAPVSESLSVDIEALAKEISKEADMIEDGDAEVQPFSMPIPPRYQAPIREAERNIAHAKTMKDLKAVAKHYGVKGFSKFKKDDRKELSDLIRQTVGVAVGKVIFADRMDEMDETEEEKTLGEVYGKMLSERNESQTRRKVRACDCIPDWMRILSDFPEEHQAMLERHDVFLVIGNDGKAEPEDSKTWESDNISDLLKDLFDTLSSLASDGQYFGSNERGEGEWGFWDHFIAATDVEDDAPGYEETTARMDAITESMNPVIIDVDVE